MSPKVGRNKNPGAGVGYGRQRGILAALAAFVLAAGAAWASSPNGIGAGDMVFMAVVTGAVALAIAAALWAMAQQNVALRLRRALRLAGARTRAAVGERDALLNAASESLIVWGRTARGPIPMAARKRCWIPVCMAHKRPSYRPPWTD